MTDDSPAGDTAPDPQQDSVAVHRWLLAGLVAVAAIATIVVVVLVVRLMGRDSDPQPQSDDRPTATALPSTRSAPTTTDPAETSTSVEEPAPSPSAPAPSATAVRTSTTRAAAPPVPSTTAPSTTPLAPTPAAPSSVGGTVPFTVAAPGAESTAGTVTLNGTRRISAPESDLEVDPASGSYLVASFAVSVSSGSTYVSAFDFRAQAADGTTYASTLGVVNQELDGTIDAGRQLRGEVAFDLPPGGTLLIHFYGPGSVPLATFSVTG